MPDIGRLNVGVVVNPGPAAAGFRAVGAAAARSVVDLQRQSRLAQESLARIKAPPPVSVTARTHVDTAAFEAGLRKMRGQTVAVPVKLSPAEADLRRSPAAQSRAGGVAAQIAAGAVGTRLGTGAAAAAMGKAGDGLGKAGDNLGKVAPRIKDAAERMDRSSANMRAAAEKVAKAVPPRDTAGRFTAAPPPPPPPPPPAMDMSKLSAPLPRQRPPAPFTAPPIAPPPAMDMSKLSAPVPRQPTKDELLAKAYEDAVARHEAATRTYEAARGMRDPGVAGEKKGRKAKGRTKKGAAPDPADLPTPLPHDLPNWDTSVVMAEIEMEEARIARAKAAQASREARRRLGVLPAKAPRAPKASPAEAPKASPAEASKDFLAETNAKSMAKMEAHNARLREQEERRWREERQEEGRRGRARWAEMKRKAGFGRWAERVRNDPSVTAEAQADQAKWNSPSDATRKRIAREDMLKRDRASLYANAREAARDAGQMAREFGGKAGSFLTDAGARAGRLLGQGIAWGAKKGLEASWWLVKNTVSGLASRLWAGVKWLPSLGGLSLAGAGAAMFAAFRSGLKDLHDADSQARRLGMTVTDLRASMLHAGPAAKAMEDGLAALAEKSALLSRGDLDAGRAFSRLGIGGAAFAGMGRMEQFDLAAARIAAVKDPLHQAAIAADVFGAAWVDLLPVIQRGAGGMAEAREMARRFGLAVTPADLANVRLAGETMHKLGSIWEGVKSQFTLGISPIVNHLAQAFDLSSVDLSGFRDTVINIAHKIAQAGALVIDAFSNTKMISDAWEIAFKRIAGFTKATVGELLNDIGVRMQETFLGRKLGGRQLADLGASLIQSGGSMELKSKAEAERFWKEAQKNPAMQKVNALFGDVRASVVNPPQRGPAPPPVNPSLVEQTKQQYAQMAEAARTPLEAFGQQMRDIRAMESAGRFYGKDGPAARGRLIARAYQDAAGSLPQTPQFAGAATLGSREAYSAVTAFLSQQNRSTVQEQMRALLEEEKRLMEESNRIAAEVLAELRRAGPAAFKI